MPFDPKKERIDKLQQGLYSRNSPEILQRERPSLSAHEYAPEDAWKTDETLTSELAETSAEPETSRVSNTFFRRLFIVSIAFFAVAAAIAGFMVFGGFNVISSKNVDIAVEGLLAVGAGEELSLDVSIRNGNNVALEESELLIEYPEGTRMPGNVTTELIRDSIELGTIEAGDTVTKTIKSVLFGEKDSIQSIKISIDYKPYGSNARFTKEKTYDIAIKSSPIIVSVNMPKEISVGQELEIGLDVTSNAAITVRDLLVRADFPFGFVSLSADPKATYGDNTWLVGNLEPKEKRTIKIRGKMEGQNDEERTFRFTAGTAHINDEKKIGISFLSSAQSIVIKKPFITLDIKLEGDVGEQEKDFYMPIGGNIRAVITWVNNLPINLSEADIVVKLSGSVINKSSVKVDQGGFYKSSDNTIRWDKNSVSKLKTISPGDSGTVSFYLNSVPMSQSLAVGGRNMEILIDTVVSGTKVAPEESPQIVSSSISKKVKISTDLSLVSRLLYSVGPFVNTGPIPPKADKKTTYTMTWSLSNTFNDVGGTAISATLPPYITWLNAIKPSTEKVTYDESNRIIRWEPSEIKAGTGYVTSPKEVSFQISFEPSLSQVGSAPNVLENQRVTGTDRFTGQRIDYSRGAVNTRMSTDPTYDSGDENVVK